MSSGRSRDLSKKMAAISGGCARIRVHRLGQDVIISLHLWQRCVDLSRQMYHGVSNVGEEQ